MESLSDGGAGASGFKARTVPRTDQAPWHGSWGSGMSNGVAIDGLALALDAELLEAGDVENVGHGELLGLSVRSGYGRLRKRMSRSQPQATVVRVDGVVEGEVERLGQPGAVPSPTLTETARPPVGGYVV